MYVAEGSAHYNSIVPMLFVVVENTLDGLDTWIIVALIVLSGALLIPVEDLSGNISNTNE